MAITARQKEVLNFISSFVQEFGYSPTFAEIAQGLGLKSQATVHKHITHLERNGFLRRGHFRMRAIELM